MSKSDSKKKPGRPRAGDNYPVAHRDPRACKHCGEKENFKSNRSAMVIGVVRIEWLRCQACKRVTRFETHIK